MTTFTLDFSHTPSIHPSVHPSVHPSTEPWHSSSLSVECLLHLPAQPCLVWGDLRGEIANPNFEHESASRGEGLLDSQPLSYDNGSNQYGRNDENASRLISVGQLGGWGGRPVRKTTRTCFEIRRVQRLLFLAISVCVCAHMYVHVHIL